MAATPGDLLDKPTVDSDSPLENFGDGELEATRRKKLQAQTAPINIILNNKNQDAQSELIEVSASHEENNVDAPSSDEWTNGEIALACVAGAFLAAGAVALFIYCPLAPALAAAFLWPKIAAATGLSLTAVIPAIVDKVAVVIEKGVVMTAMKEVSSFLSNAAKGIQEALSSTSDTSSKAVEIEMQNLGLKTPVSSK